MITAEQTSIKFQGNFDASLYGALLRHAFLRSLALETKLPEWVVAMKGMSGKKYRYLINNLVETVPNARYLEIGSWAGSTACAAIHGNKLRAICVDNWSQFNGPKDIFKANVGQALSPDVEFGFIENDFRKVDYSSIGKFNIYLFDGPHEEEDQYDGIMVTQSALDDHYILIVDDFNWEPVRKGTYRAIEDSGAKIECAIEVRTTQDNSHPQQAMMESSDWHNGYILAVCKK